MARRSDPRVALARFIEKTGVSRREAARQLHVSHPTLLAWIDGSRTPEVGARREAIERWTSGQVPASSWENDEERAKREAIEAVAPFQPVEDATGTD